MEKVEQGMGMEPIGDDLAVADRSPHNLATTEQQWQSEERKTHRTGAALGAADLVKITKFWALVLHEQGRT